MTIHDSPCQPDCDCKPFLDYLHNFRNNTCNSCNSPQTKTPICKVCKIDTKCNQYLLNCYLCNLSKIHVLGFRKWIYSRHINMECQRRCSSKSQFNIRRIRFSYINEMFKLWWLKSISLFMSYDQKVQHLDILHESLWWQIVFESLAKWFIKNKLILVYIK